MHESNNNSLLIDETDADRRRMILDGQGLSLDLVAALAGDRPLTAAEKHRLDDLQKSRAPKFFSDLLYVITHQYFSPEVAEDLWNEILLHKHGLSTTLGRNVRITVAALDFLSNITDNMASTTLVGEEQIEEIVGLSLRDGLTGLFNHTYFNQQIDFEVRRYVRYGTFVSLVLMDIDDFKEINDTYGHPEGDRVLAALGKTLLRGGRVSDVCCRYGGEEFAIILPMTQLPEAGRIANRLKTELAKPAPNGRSVTVSMGVASCGKTTRTYHDLVEKADAALYRAKKEGKNRVVVAAREVQSDGNGAELPRNRLRSGVDKTPSPLSTPMLHEAGLTTILLSEI